MPTYQYRCTNCSAELEAVQKFTDDPLTICPTCHGPLRKVFSPVGVMFKGSGFYVTDSRSKGRSQAAAAGPSHAEEHTADHHDDHKPADHTSADHTTPAHKETAHKATGHKADSPKASTGSTPVVAGSPVA